jgi:elongation factor G
MANFDLKHIKNVALIGHPGSGKTTLAETMLFESGMINRRGAVEDKNTVSDYTEIEHERQNSIFTSVSHANWRGYKINLLDTPGYDDFVGEVVSALKVADTSVMVLNAQFGVEVSTELIWDYIEEYQTPTIFAINHLDQDKSDFDKTVEQAKDRFGNKVTVVQYPLNQGLSFNSIVDVLKMVMYKFPADGGKPEKLPIPDEEKDKADKLHNELVESVAENDEELMELYFEKGELDEDEMRKGLKLSMLKHELFPLFCLSAKKNMGSGRLMGFIDNVAPSANEMPPFKLSDGKELKCDPSLKTSLFVFKTISEPHLGEMSFFKVTSGIMKTGTDLVNSNNGNTERLNQLYSMEGNKRENVDELVAGDIGATVKLKSTHTNHTLHEKGFDIEIEPIKFPDSRIRTAIIAKKQGDEEKMAMALHHIADEDPTIIIEQSSELKQTIMHGQGEMQFAILKWKLDHMYHIETEYIEPKIPYRETIQKMVKSEYRHKKQSGGAGQFAQVHMMVEPYYEGMPKPADLNVRNTEVIDLPWGGNLVFNNCIVGGAIDTRFMPSIMKGIMDKMNEGPLTGSYVRDVRVSVFDGKMHSVDSNDAAFKMAGTMAFKSAFQQADPKILEPIYRVEVLVPDEVMGDVMSDLQTRRAIIQGIESDGHYQKIIAKVPLAELHKYSSTLRSISQGRAKHTRTFEEYAPVPFDIQKKLISDYQSNSDSD